MSTLPMEVTVRLDDGYYRTTYPDGEELIQYVKDNKNDVGQGIETEIKFQKATFTRVYLISEAARSTMITQLVERRLQIRMAKREYASTTKELQDQWSKRIEEIESALKELGYNEH